MSTQRIKAWRAVGASITLALLFSVLGWATLQSQAYAASDQPADVLASIPVNTTTPGVSSDGLCSIVEAIENANADAAIHADCAAGSGSDTISLPSDAVMIFTTTHNLEDGGNALPVITSTITIIGDGATLVRDTNNTPFFRFFHVAVDGNLTVNELGMRNGRAGQSGTQILLLGGGAVLNRGTLSVVDSNLSYNRASYGGAIYSTPVTGSLSVNNTTFSFNDADLFGGAIYNFGPAVINGGLLRYNEATVTGGAIVNDSATMSVTNATILDNITAGSGAGITSRAVTTDSHLSLQSTNVISNAAAVNGGGLYNTASNDLTSVVVVNGSSFTANRADSILLGEGMGGGILNGWAQGVSGGVAQMQVSQSSIMDNLAQTGGGIANVNATGFTTRTVEIVVSQSTLARNIAAGVGTERGSGGGLYNSNGDATVVNSTVSANQALGDDTVLGGRGGGIGNVGRGISTTLQVINSTIAFNEATQAGGGVAVLNQGLISATTIEVGNTLIVNNALTVTQSVSNAAVLVAIASPQVITGTESCALENSTSTSLGGNIEDGATCGLNTATDLQSTDIPLEPLADNGGPTLTHLISNLSLAYNRGVDALCIAAPVNGVDQRGVTRPQASQCDIGAVELVPVEPEDSMTHMPAIFLRYSSSQ